MLTPNKKKEHTLCFAVPSCDKDPDANIGVLVLSVVVVFVVYLGGCFLLLLGVGGGGGSILN